MAATSRTHRGVKPSTATVPYTGPARPDIQTLVDNYRNLYPPLDDVTYGRLKPRYLANEQKTSKIVLSARGNLVDGYHRCLILLQNDRKALTTDDYTIDYTAVDDLTEMKAHVGYQEDGRQSTSADQAAMARHVMRHFGWSANKFAEEFDFNPERVKKWLQRNPDPAFDAEMAEQGRVGKDGKVYTAVPDSDDGPPKAKTVRLAPKSGAAVERWIHKYTAELTNPELATWIVDHADEADHAQLADMLNRIATAMTAIAEALTPAETGSF